MPVALAPTGLAGMQWADGEILAARAAERFGVPFTLSTVSVCSIEDVAAHTSRPFWFQLYLMKDRAFMERLVARARDAGCSALVLTMDLPVQGQRHLDIKNGLSTPPRPTLRNLVNLATKPRWCLNMARTERRTFRNIVGHVEGVSDASSLAHWVSEQFDQTLGWDHLRWLRRIWDRKLIVKGIMDPEDARAAAPRGGGCHRRVQPWRSPAGWGRPPAYPRCRPIAEAVGARTEVLFDGGIRSGQDVLKALALGAAGVLIGRAFLYGPRRHGRGGGDTLPRRLIHRELDLTMALCGLTDTADAARALLDAPANPEPAARLAAPV